MKKLHDTFKPVIDPDTYIIYLFITSFLWLMINTVSSVYMDVQFRLPVKDITVYVMNYVITKVSFHIINIVQVN